MFLFSRKVLSLLLVMAVGFGGEHQSAQGLEKCYECDHFEYVCNANLDDGLPNYCHSPHGACAMTKEGDKIKKFCEFNSSIWSDNGKETGKPKCEKNKACYCNDADLCNKDKAFGLDGTGGGNGGGSGSVGMLPIISILPWLVPTVAVTLVPSI